MCRAQRRGEHRVDCAVGSRLKAFRCRHTGTPIFADVYDVKGPRLLVGGVLGPRMRRRSIYHPPSQAVAAINLCRCSLGRQVKACIILLAPQTWDHHQP